MTGDERVLCAEIMDLCRKAKEAGLLLFLSNTETDTNIYGCSSTDPGVITACMTQDVKYRNGGEE